MKRMQALLVTSAATTVMVLATASHADDETFDYVVQPGDKCDTVAAKALGSAARIDIVHGMNPQLGPPPHNLKPGSVLHLRRPGPEAKISYVRNRVDAFTPAQHPGKPDEPLMRGHRVSTLDASNAEVRFASNAVIQLGERTLVVILGSTRGAVSRTGTAADTTLVNGSLRSRLSSLAGKRSNVNVSTPAGHNVDLSSGEAQVTVDPRQTTRVAVYKGATSITSQKQTVAVNEGFGSKAEKDKPPTPPRPLPRSPKWVTALPAIVFASNPVDVVGQFAPGTGTGPAPVRWHLQLAKDDVFNDLVVDATVDLAVTKIEARGLVAGTYLARVSAIDNDQFEGAPGPTSVVIVTPMSIKPASSGGQDATIDVPAGLFCGIDSAPLALLSGPIAFKRGPMRKLRCASTADGEGSSETAIAAQSIGPLAVSARVESAGAVVNSARVVMTVLDPSKQPVSGSKVVARASDGVTLTEAAPGDAPGTYVAMAQWPPGTKTFRLHLDVNGVDAADSDAVALPALPPAPLAPPAKRAHPVEAALLAGIAVPTSDLLTGPSLGAEVGGRWQPSTLSLAFALRATWEHHTFGSSAPCNAGPSPGGCAGMYSFDLTSDLVSFALPVTLRLGAPDARWLPYAGIAPMIMIDRSAITSSRNGFSSSDSDTRPLFGLAGLLGVELRTGEVSRLFFEAGYRGTPELSGGAGAFTRSAWLFHLGFRTGL